MLIARIRWPQDPPRTSGEMGPQDRVERVVGPFARVGDVQRWRDEYVTEHERHHPGVQVVIEVTRVEDATNVLLQLSTSHLQVVTSQTSGRWVQPW